MKYESLANVAVINLEEGEDEHQVLRALLKASFALARPDLDNCELYRRNHVLTDEKADMLIALTANGNILASLKVVEGRNCYTTFSRNGSPREIVLDLSTFRPHRGTPGPMLDYAAALLRGEAPGCVSTEYLFTGQSLDDVLLPQGFVREEGESDWCFRKRAFADLWQENDLKAAEIFIGQSSAEWDQNTFEFLLKLKKIFRENDLGPDDFRWFAQNVPEDPVVIRRRGVN